MLRPLRFFQAELRRAPFVWGFKTSLIPDLSMSTEVRSLNMSRIGALPSWMTRRAPSAAAGRAEGAGSRPRRVRRACRVGRARRSARSHGPATRGGREVRLGGRRRPTLPARRRAGTPARRRVGARGRADGRQPGPSVSAPRPGSVRGPPSNRGRPGCQEGLRLPVQPRPRGLLRGEGRPSPRLDSEAPIPSCRPPAPEPLTETAETCGLSPHHDAPHQDPLRQALWEVPFAVKDFTPW